MDSDQLNNLSGGTELEEITSEVVRMYRDQVSGQFEPMYSLSTDTSLGSHVEIEFPPAESEDIQRGVMESIANKFPSAQVIKRNKSRTWIIRT